MMVDDLGVVVPQLCEEQVDEWRGAERAFRSCAHLEGGDRINPDPV
jgi:hypothetical protein